MAIVFLITTLASLAVLMLGLMGLLGRLPRNHFAGIRTSATLASDRAWEDAHRVGSAPMIFAAVAALMVGLALLPFVLADKIGDEFAVVIVVVQAALIVGGVLASAVLAHRTAASVPRA
ncbi:MAG: SdpI family protein [Dehalococcoidia bacterium]